MRAAPPDLFGAEVKGPEGFGYREGVVGEAEERELLARFAGMEFRPYDFHGYEAKRRVVSFGWAYDLGEGQLNRGEVIPDFLLSVRARAAAFAGIDEARLEHVLVNEYQAGAGIGWHRDRPQFGEVIGVSLGAPGLLRFRRKRGEGWERVTVPVVGRSAYVLKGPARKAWQHSLPPVEALRYSITFRTPAGG